MYNRIRKLTGFKIIVVLLLIGTITITGAFTNANAGPNFTSNNLTIGRLDSHLNIPRLNMTILPPPTLTILSATDPHGYEIPYDKLMYVPSECMPESPGCPDILLHGKVYFTVQMQNNYNPIQLLECRLDGYYAYKASEDHYPCDAYGDSTGPIGKLPATFDLPGATWSNPVNPDLTPYHHTFTIKAIDTHGQYSNVAEFKWRTGHGFD